MKWIHSLKDNLPKLTQEETESIIDNLTKQKALGPDRYTDKFCQTFMEEIIPIFYNIFQKIEANAF